MNDEIHQINLQKYATVKQTAAMNSWCTEAALRAYIFAKDTNGFAPCVKKLGRKVLIDLNAFQQWIEGQQEVNHG